MATRFCATRRTALTFASIVLIGGTLSVTALAEDLGPPIGIKAPDIGTRLDQTGRPRTLTDLMGKNGVVLLRPIGIGPAADEVVIVTAGLDTGDRVVTEGYYRLQPGVPVAVDPPSERSAEISPAQGRTQ